jgi:hypothetical protein
MRPLVGQAKGGFQDGPATWAKFNAPTGLAYSHDGSWIAVAVCVCVCVYLCVRECVCVCVLGQVKHSLFGLGAEK